MVLGADTGFFIARAKNHPRSMSIWQELEENKHELIVSTVTINELLVYYFKRGMSAVGMQLVAMMIDNKSIDLIPVSVEIARLSARYRHGVGLPTVDSLILATCLDSKCNKLFSTDTDFRIIHEQGVIPVELLE